MDKLHAKLINDAVFVPEEGQRDLVCSNTKSFRCPSLGINSNQVSEEIALDYFAGILVKAFLDKKENDHKQ